MPPSSKNVWIAASDGDLDRVKTWIESGISPNQPDENTYTPMHAAASYGHISVLEYLISVGGNVNITDEDNDTPLYTVENIQTAKWLIDHGAEINRVNGEGISPADHLEEEFPEVASYIRSLIPNQTSTTSLPPSSHLPSEHAADAASEALTASLLSSVHQLVENSNANGDAEPSEEEIRQAVQRVVFHGMGVGIDMGESARANASAASNGTSTRSFSTIQEEGDEEDDVKRPKRSNE